VRKAMPTTHKPSFLARMCVHCPVCRRARRTQRGLAFWLVSKVERGVCPFGRAYERAFGRKPHEPEQARDAAAPAAH